MFQNKKWIPYDDPRSIQLKVIINGFYDCLALGLRMAIKPAIVYQLPKYTACFFNHLSKYIEGISRKEDAIVARFPRLS